MCYQLMVNMDGTPWPPYILRMIIDKEKNDTSQRFEFVNASLFDIEML